MPSVFITDFKYGMDRRRPRVAGQAGTLWTGCNVHISRGGDIERPKKFVPTYTLPANTFGLGAVRGQLYTFGSIAPPTMPNGVQYQQLAAPDGSAMTRVLDVRPTDGKLYVIARYANGNVYHFYNGVRVTDWDTVAASHGDFPTTASYMADLINEGTDVSALANGSVITLTANVPGTAFTAAKNTTDFGGTSDQDITLATLQANVPAIAEVRAKTVLTLTGSAGGGLTDITINGVSLMQAPVAWATSDTATAAAVVVQINDKSATHLYAATSVGNQITITAPVGSGATPNLYPVVPIVTGGLLAIAPAMDGGVTAVAGVAQVMTATFSGTWEVADSFTIILNGVSYTTTNRAAATGQSAMVYKKRIWSPANSLENYSRLNTFTDFTNADPSSGAGFLNIANDAEGSERLTGAGVFNNLVAFFSRRNIRLYAITTDATATALSAQMDNSGALSPRAILGYGNTDLFYLDETGLRSIRARVGTGTPYVDDLGTPIDPFLRAYMDTLSLGTLQRACAVMEPRDARAMIAIGNYIFVLSYFPSAEISAWSYYDPGFAVSDFARCYNRLYARSGNTVYLYGGATGLVYPGDGEMVATVELPFIASSPPQKYATQGFDMSCTNTWQVDILPDPTNENAAQRVGAITGTTYPGPDIGLNLTSTHFAVKLTCSKGGPATISNISIHDGSSEPNV